MRDAQVPLTLTSQQIATLQDMILEKQLEIATAQSEGQTTEDAAALREQMSHITDLLMALNLALPEHQAADVEGLVTIRQKDTAR